MMRLGPELLELLLLLPLLSLLSPNTVGICVLCALVDVIGVTIDAVGVPVPNDGSTAAKVDATCTTVGSGE
jgi:hypothetical protein